ncbi:hypothetical protein C1645_879223 [Glomus cerebriforme]|uniref:Uncharacterized protein n=1 Tax=Glomus cerebriforme TaxID=658196 RepID=A0A397SLU4_9GLOM|nr:hypothetical protein C1645_833787 [Glomus cerebriforme]RIA85586.1 hypothetical protein C1645_879223 [Glomus cerebriforme]
MSETQVKIVTSNKSETFDLLELPDPESQLIKAECSVINKDIDLQNLVSDFTQLGMLIRLAENGAVDRYQIQIQIRDIGRIITRLVGDTSLAIHSFEKASAEVAETLKTVYEYLVSSFEDEALITLASIEEIAKEMLNTSERLKQDASNACKEVQKVSNAANKQKGEDNENKEKADKNRKEYTSKEAEWKKNKDNVQNELNKLDTKINNVTTKIEKLEKSAANWTIVDAIIPFLPFSKIAKNANEQADKDREEKKKLIEDRRRQIESRREANEKIATFAFMIGECKDQTVLLDTVVNSLHHAISALNNIEGIMETARIFWEKMYLHCKQLSTEKFRQKITNGLEKYDEDKRQNMYQSLPFKREAIKVYAKWIAVRVTCHGYKSQIEVNHHDLVEYLKESPNRDQSYAIIEDLAIKLKEKTEKTKRNLRLEESKMNEQEANLENDIQANAITAD